MRLFDVPGGIRVRITSALIRWVDVGDELKVAENLTWEGTTTDEYFTFREIKRRLIVNHSIPMFKGHGTWQRDCECELVNI